jgi:hypothetical protein
MQADNSSLNLSALLSSKNNPLRAISNRCHQQRGQYEPKIYYFNKTKQQQLLKPE